MAIKNFESKKTDWFPIMVIVGFVYFLYTISSESNSIELQKNDWECKAYHYFAGGKHCSNWVEKNHHGE